GDAREARRPGLALDELDLEPVVSLRDDPDLVPVRVEAGEGRLDLGGQRGLGLDETVRDDNVGCDRAEVGAEPRGPSLELVQRSREAVVARLRQLEVPAAAIGPV